VWLEGRAVIAQGQRSAAAIVQEAAR
jgi:hypothetical protein